MTQIGTDLLVPSSPFLGFLHRIKGSLVGNALVRTLRKCIN